MLIFIKINNVNCFVWNSPSLSLPGPWWLLHNLDSFIASSTRHLDNPCLPISNVPSSQLFLTPKFPHSINSELLLIRGGLQTSNGQSQVTIEIRFLAGISPTKGTHQLSIFQLVYKPPRCSLNPKSQSSLFKTGKIQALSS